MFLSLHEEHGVELDLEGARFRLCDVPLLVDGAIRDAEFGCFLIRPMNRGCLGIHSPYIDIGILFCECERERPVAATRIKNHPSFHEFEGGCEALLLHLAEIPSSRGNPVRHWNRIPSAPP